MESALRHMAETPCERQLTRQFDTPAARKWEAFNSQLALCNLFWSFFGLRLVWFWSS